MKLNYKNQEIIRSHKGITVYSDDKTIVEKLHKNNIEAELISNIIYYLAAHPEVTLIKNQEDLANKQITTVGKIINREETKNGMYNYSLQVPGERAVFFLSSYDKLNIDSYYELEGKLIYNKWYNDKRRSNLEKQIGYKRYGFKANKTKELRIKPVEYTHERPRYELHCHTIHSKRDGFIDLSELQHAYDTGKLATVAITNHGLSNGFTDCISSFSKGDFGVIPAVEFYVVDEAKLKYEQDLWDEEQQGNTERDLELTTEIEELNELINANKTILAEKTYAKGEAKLIREQNKGFREKLKPLKTELKELTAEIKKLAKTRPVLGDQERYHVTCLVKAKDSTFKYKGEDIAYNPGIYELNKAISVSNTTNFGITQLQKWMGKVCRSMCELA